jgi:hypothetical protein
MNESFADASPQRRGVIGQIKDYLVNVLGATRDRMETFTAEVEHRVFRLIWMIVWALAGVVCLGLALVFAMLTVIFGLDLPPLYAFGIPMLVFLLVGAVALVMFKKTKSSKRAPETGKS